MSIVELYEMDTKDAVGLDYEKLGMLVINRSGYQNVFSQQKQLEDVMTLFLKYRNPEWISRILKELNSFQLETLEFRSINLIDLMR